MENFVLTVHLILALLLIGVVLLQRSEGGGLGMGGGGGGGAGGGVMTGRQAANALSRATWLLATGFIITSLALTVLAARNSAGGSVVDRINPDVSAPAGNDGSLTYTPPPGASGTTSAPGTVAPGAGQPILPPTTTEPAAETTAPETAPDAAAPAAPAAPAATDGAAAPQPVTPPAATN